MSENKSEKSKKVFVVVEAEIKDRTSKKYPQFGIDYDRDQKTGDFSEKGCRDFAERFVTAHQEADFSVQIAASHVVRQSDRFNLIAVGNVSCVRTLSFNGGNGDPYVLYHTGGAEKLDDATLRGEYRIWIETQTGGAYPDQAEHFEEFLEYLEEEKGYVQLAPAFEMYEF